MIMEPTHIPKNSFSCTDLLVFTTQPNFIVDSGNHPLLHPNCHHQIIYVKVNFKILYSGGLALQRLTLSCIML